MLPGRIFTVTARIWIAIFIALPLLLFPWTAYGKLIILRPEAMLDQADVILVGTVESLKPGREQDVNEGKIRLELVLKGEARQPTITLKEIWYMERSPLQRIPPEGTRILLLLKDHGEQGLGYFADNNHIAIIENDQVAGLYNATNNDRGAYTEAYNAFYKAHIEKAVPVKHPPETAAKQSDLSSAAGNADISPVSPAREPSRSAFSFYYVLVPLFLLIAGIGYRLWRERKT